MNFQNDETNGHVCDTHRINHTKVIAVIPQSTQRIDFTTTLTMMNGRNPAWATLSGCRLTPVLPAQSLPPAGSPAVRSLNIHRQLGTGLRLDLDTYSPTEVGIPGATKPGEPDRATA